MCEWPLRHHCCEAMLRARYPELVVKPLRGNLDTRLGKLDRGDYAAIILAAAGLKRLGLGDAEYERVMALPPRSWHEFPTYKRRFERLRPLFHMLAKRNLVPMSFYLKYCLPAGE